ncbi:hypothetical protein TIFTF001_044475 [Ficus carica]|uniref:Retrotransposon gag domain-containing protein n=1 Tax=Ficus carica TaxID=3494 RepID=A0AA88D8R5_FICCA|nr:hypothetical protein TIFTF001_044451 [Ficus carica]GMN30348.1 hypothetical protein TIFTF001_044462 [Ficus carica]GMN30354.1 hypothetical protein TIFTF001_044464 [Ficus carica]GMN30402.1 hypothetical protein TIFTF001_044475 [Ficus carica]
MDILTENVRSLIEVVKALVDREAHNIQLPPVQQEAAESTQSRPPRSASRPRNPLPTGNRSGRSNRENLGRQQRDGNEDPGRVCLRSRHTQATRSGAAEPLAAARNHPDNNLGEAENVRRNTTSVFDRLGRPGIHQRLARERSCGLEQVGAVDPPFTPVVLASPYLARFKMPSVESYNGTTNADEHLENYQAYMLIQNANEAAFCKSFCLTLTGAAWQWYRRLAPGSIGCFKQLADAFAAAFVGRRPGS